VRQLARGEHNTRARTIASLMLPPCARCGLEREVQSELGRDWSGTNASKRNGRSTTFPPNPYIKLAGNGRCAPIRGREERNGKGPSSRLINRIDRGRALLNMEIDNIRY